MDGSISDLLFWGGLMAAGALLLWRITNNNGDATSRQQRELERRLARYPASAGAVVIKGQPRRALWRMLPAALLAMGLALATSQAGRGLLCDRLDAADAARWTLRLIFLGMPAALALLAAFEVSKAFRVLRGGYAPPLDAVLARDTIAVTGWRAKLQGAVGLVMAPLLVGVVACLAYGMRDAFDEDRLQARVAAQCAARHGAGGVP